MLPAQTARGYVSVWASAEDDYPDGEMYVDGVAASGDVAFRAYYEPDLPLILSALARAAEHYLPFALVSLVLFLIPGQALFILLGDVGAQSAIEHLALAVGAGLAALSLGSILLLYFGAPVAWLGFGAAAALLVFLGAEWRKLRLRQQGLNAHTVSQSNFTLWSLGALTLLAVAVVFLQIRDTPVPLWKDSPIHAETIANILSQGHLPTNTFYHLGSHSIIALLVSLSGAAIPIAMLLVGQLLIVQTGLSVFLLTKRLTGSDIAGLVSAACVWFLSPMPAYFTTWGRYPLLLGSALLPLALLLGIEFIERVHFDWRACLLAIITFWGMAFAHVRLTLFYLIFAAIYLAYHIWRAHERRERVNLVARAVIALVAGAPIGLLWLGAINTGFTDASRTRIVGYRGHRPGHRAISAQPNRFDLAGLVRRVGGGFYAAGGQRKISAARDDRVDGLYPGLHSGWRSVELGVHKNGCPFETGSRRVGRDLVDCRRIGRARHALCGQSGDGAFLRPGREGDGLDRGAHAARFQVPHQFRRLVRRGVFPFRRRLVDSSSDRPLD